MPLNGRDEEVKHTPQHEVRQRDKTVPLIERFRPLQERIAARSSTGLEADKAFFDELSGDI